MEETRFKELVRLAKKEGLHIAVWRPCDGTPRRYRFMFVEASYDADRGLFTARGLKQAEVWFMGYCTGLGVGYSDGWKDASS